MTFSIDKCTKFNHEAAARGEKVVTRDGLPYVYGGFNPGARIEVERITGWVDGLACSHSENGRHYAGAEVDSPYDLFMAPKTREVWVRIEVTQKGDTKTWTRRRYDELQFIPCDGGYWLGPAIKHGEVEE